MDEVTSGHMVVNGYDFLITYGSQTGQSEAIARIIERRAVDWKLKPRFHVLDNIGKKFFLEKEALVVVVCSSTGDGDPPENAARFVRLISRRSLPSNFLSNLTYALLGLGDSNFTTYQGCPQLIEKQFLRLGAKKLIETGAADDQIGLELTVEPWMTRLFEALKDWFHLDRISMEQPCGSVDVNRMKELSLEEKEENEENLSSILKALCAVSPEWPPEDVPCLIRGTQKLQQDASLRVPVAVAPYLNCEIASDEFPTEGLPWQNGSDVIGAFGQEYHARVISVTKLTSLEILKPKQEIVVEIENNVEIHYEPGDAFYLVAPNPRDEVDLILARMGFLDQADQKCIVTVKPQTTRRSAAVPPYIPEISTLRYMLTYCLDIRRSPGRPLLRVLAECTSNELQKRRILELCSAQGVEEFTKFVRQAGLSLVDFLLAFPSCRPTPECLIELLPRLLPRPYSVTCIKEFWEKQLRFVFSLMHFEAVGGRCYFHYGLCSGWLASLRPGQQVMMFLKKPSRFRLPPPMHCSCDIARIPLIMVCTGTGLAPFLSFFQKLEILGAEKYVVPRELYFGCRNVDTDCIYQGDIRRYLNQNILSHVSVCESQSNNGAEKKYVQDALLGRGREIVDILLRKKDDEYFLPLVFVCGSAVSMSKSVADVFVRILMEFSGKQKEEAELFLAELRKNDQYLEDVW